MLSKQFNLQARLIQSEPSLLMVLDQPNIKGADELYYDMGASCNPGKYSRFLSYANFLNLPQLENARDVYACEGIKSLLFGKLSKNGTPLILSLTEAKASKFLEPLTPYILALPKPMLMQLVQGIKVTFGVMLPAYLSSFFDKCVNTNYSENETVRNTRITNLAIFFTLQTAMLLYRCPKYNREKTEITGYEMCNLTLSPQLLMTYAQKGVFSVSPDANVAISESIATATKQLANFNGKDDELFGTKIRTALENNVVTAAKLTLKSLQGVTFTNTFNVKYDIVTPQSGLALSKPEAQVIPLRYMLDYCEGILSKLATIECFEIACVNNGESYSYKGTIIPDVYRSVYANQDQIIVNNKANIPVGFSSRRNALIVLNLESSIHSETGYGTINPFTITQIVPIKRSDINTSAHSLQPTSILAYFQSKISKLPANAYEKLVNTIPDLKKVYKATEYTLDGIIEVLYKVHYSVLLKFMLANPSVFGTEAELMKAISELGTPLSLTPIELTGSNADKVKTLLQWLDTSAIHISYTATGNDRELLCSNNTGILKSYLGNDYVRRFESWANKTAELKSVLLSKPSAYGNAAKVAALIAEYGLTKTLDATLLTNIDAASIDAWLEAADAKRTKRNSTPNPNLVLARNLQATHAGNFFQSFNIDNIKAVYRAQVKLD